MAVAPVTLKFSSYDLKQDLLEEEKNLANETIICKCSSIYKREDIVERMLEIWRTIGAYDPSFQPMMDKWMDIIKTAENVLHKEVRFSSDELKKQTNDINCFMGMQIYNFYWKSVKKYEFPLFLRNFVFTQRGTINTYKTIELILEKEEIPLKQKFTLSCKYFMDIKVIQKYFIELPDAVKFWFLLFKYPSCETCIPLYYWSRTIQRKRCYNFKFYEESSSSESDLSDYSDLHINCKLFTWAVKTKNEIAVQYLWENLISTWSGKKTILNGLGADFMETPKRNIFMYLLTKVTDDNLSEWTRYVTNILPALFKDSRWHQYFANTVEFLQSKVSFSFYPTLYVIVCKMKGTLDYGEHADEKYWTILKDCLIIMPSQEKFSDFPKLKEMLILNGAKILFPAFMKMDLDVIKKFARVYREANVSEIFYNEIGMSMLAIVAENEAFDFIDIIFKELSKSDDEFEFFRKRFSDKTAFNVCKSLILKNELEILGKFIDWFSKSYSVKKAKGLKSSLPSGFGSAILKELVRKAARIHDKQVENVPISLKLINEQNILSSNEYQTLFGNIDSFLSLCFESEEIILQIKQSIFEVNEAFPKRGQFFPKRALFYDVFSNLIINGKFDFINKLCKWSQCSEEAVRKFRSWLPVDADIMRKLRNTEGLGRFFKYLEWIDFGDGEA